MEIFIVSSSLKWALEPLVTQLNLPLKSILATETKILNGKVQNQAKGIIPHQQGKASKLLDNTYKKRPLFACGNTIWDYELIGSSTHVKLAVSSSFHLAEDTFVKEGENQLQIKAKKEGWLHHCF